MEVNPEIRERILRAAQTLFEQAGHKELPTVDAVRKLSRTSMNDASTVMREWRRSQIASASAAAVSVPERRGEAEKLRHELFAAFEAQGAELEALKAKLTYTEGSAAPIAAAESAGGESLRRITALTESAHTAAACVQEIAKWAEDLKATLGVAQAVTKAITTEVEAERQWHGVTREALTVVTTELVSLKAKVEAQAGIQLEQSKRLKRVEGELTQLREATGIAREEAAQLRGQAEALKAQQSELLRLLEDRERERPGSTLG